MYIPLYILRYNLYAFDTEDFYDYGVVTTRQALFQAHSKLAVM